MYALKSLTIAAVLCLVVSVAQAVTGPPDIEWVGTYGGDEVEFAFKIIQTPDSGYAFLGLTTSFAEEGDDNYYLVKLDENGDTLWTRVYWEPGGVGPRDMINTYDGGLMICGNETTCNPDSIYFAMKTDNLGEPEWVRRLGGTGWPVAVIQSHDSGFVFAGFSRSESVPITRSLLKLNWAGDSLWTRTFGNSNWLLGVTETASGNIVAAGWCGTVYPYGVYVSASDEQGNEVWSHCLRSDSSQSAWSTSTKYGKMFVAGSYGSRSGVWVMDTTGTVLDSLHFGDSTEVVQCVDATLDGGFVTCGHGHFSTPQPALLSTRIRKFDRDLNQEWVVELDSTYSQLHANSIHQTYDGGYIFGGYAEDHDAAPDKDLYTDIYAVKLASQIPHLTEFLIDGSSPGDHLINHTPEFRWAIIDPAGIGQAEFEVLVGTDLHWDEAEMWEAGVIVSSDTFIVYSGEPFTDGETYYLRIRVSNGVDWSPWYQTSFRMNSVPSIPIALEPTNDEMVSNQPTLTVEVSSDAEADTLTYEFYALNDSTCGDITFYDTTGIPEGDAVAAWQVDTPLQENCRHHWRARAFDGYEYSDWTEWQSFFVDGTPEPPTAPTPSWPPDTSGLPVFDLTPTFAWGASFDPDPFDTVMYTLELAVDSAVTFVNTIDSISGTECTLGYSLDFSTQYWWRVSAFDVAGHTTLSEYEMTFWTWTLGDLNHNHDIDIADLIFLVTFMFQEGPEPYPPFIADINGDCGETPDIADLIHLVTYMFQDGPPPAYCD